MTEDNDRTPLPVLSRLPRAAASRRPTAAIRIGNH